MGRDNGWCCIFHEEGGHVNDPCRDRVEHSGPTVTVVSRAPVDSAMAPLRGQGSFCVSTDEEQLCIQSAATDEFLAYRDGQWYWSSYYQALWDSRSVLIRTVKQILQMDEYENILEGRDPEIVQVKVRIQQNERSPLDMDEE